MTVQLSTVEPPLRSMREDVFTARFNRRPFLIEHRLDDHPLFALPRLVELAQQLPTANVEYNAGNLPISQDPHATPHNGLCITETIRRIEECQSWMVLKNVESVPEYRQMLDECLNQIEHYTNALAPGMCRREGFIFISSPGSVTPYHIDPENNFLLQIRGSKEVYMYDADDREVISEQAIEDFFSGAHRNLTFDERLREREHHFVLTPGDGLHFPVVAPHYVQNGPAVSISFSITFQTNPSRDRQSLYRFNRQLRQWGLRPAPVGQRPRWDRLKLACIHTLRRPSSLYRVFTSG